MTTEEYKAAAAYWTQKERTEMPVGELKKLTEEYLEKCGVCALATGAGDYVRCTPLEYSFHDEKFWIFTEGGEKFIGLEKNKNVSLSVFDANPGFGCLKSVQVMGVTEVIEPMSDVYISHAEYKKIPVKALQNLADHGKPMNLLCIKPVRMDILCSDFKKDGYDSRQVLIYNLE